LYPIKLISSN